MASTGRRGGRLLSQGPLTLAYITHETGVGGEANKDEQVSASQGRAGLGAKPGSKLNGKRGREVAIIEDEVELLRAYSAYLRKHGYRSVYTFVSGEDFLRAMRGNAITPELALVDYRLPGDDGIKVAREAKRLRSELKVVVTTADDSVLPRARSSGFHFLQKPFSLAALAVMLEQI